LDVVFAAPEEFSVARGGTVLSFPRDHGAHSDYQTEWWYYTGQLYGEGEEPFVTAPRYGFQLTFFRRAAKGIGGFTQEYLAHGALTDIRNKKTFFASRLGGGGLGVAGAAEPTLMAWSGDWAADLVGRNHILRFSLPVASTRGEPGSLRLVGMPTSSEWRQGDNGFSRKGNCPSCASIYYSIPGLQLTASLLRGGELQELRGVGWMDHEYMSHSLEKSQKGWDWMGLTFKDGKHLMIFRLRGEKGAADYVSGTLRTASGSIQLGAQDLSMTPLERWRSSESGAEYPVSWRLEIPAHSISVVVSARVSACEVGGEGGQDGEGLLRYWEGPVAAADESVVGYLEMTGYSGKISL
jgi:predicted secreted hydrolase